MRDELLEEWRRSKADKQVQVVEETGPADDPVAAEEEAIPSHRDPRWATPPSSPRPWRPSNRIDALGEQHDRLLGRPSHAPNPLAYLMMTDLEKLTDDGLPNFDDDQLFAIGARLHARYGLTTVLPRPAADKKRSAWTTCARNLPPKRFVSRPKSMPWTRKTRIVARCRPSAFKWPVCCGGPQQETNKVQCEGVRSVFSGNDFW